MMPGITDDQTIEFLGKILESTRNRTLTWREAAVVQSLFTAQTREFVYMIGSRDSDDSPPYQFTISRKLQIQTRPVLTIETTIGSAVLGAKGTINQLLNDLFELVANSARGLEHLYPDLMSNLYDEEPF
jgi:hypothetical protein